MTTGTPKGRLLLANDIQTETKVTREVSCVKTCEKSVHVLRVEV